MSDVADILGYGNRISSSSNMNALGDEAQRIMQGGERAKNAAGVRPLKKPKGMSREVFRLLGVDNASFTPSIQPAAPVVGGFKNKRANALKGKWLWQRIATSSVAAPYQQCLPFRWTKADLSFVDYPYAKFNIQYNHAKYTDEEYTNTLQDPHWSKEDSDKLIAACEQYDLRWPVIADRVQLSTSRPVEDMQARYFAIKAVLAKSQPQRNLKPPPARAVPTSSASTGAGAEAVKGEQTAGDSSGSGTGGGATAIALDEEAATMPLDDLGSFALDGDILDGSFLPPLTSEMEVAAAAAAAAATGSKPAENASDAAAAAPVVPVQIAPLPTEIFDIQKEKTRRLQQDLLFKRFGDSSCSCLLHTFAVASDSIR